MNKKLEDIETIEEYYEIMSKYTYNLFFQSSICEVMTEDTKLHEDPSNLSGKVIIDRTRAFFEQKPKPVNIPIFLKYLTAFPVSMCSWEVTPLLRMIISLHYRAGIPNEDQKNMGAEVPSYQDLAEIFVRSKSTIAECLNKTEQFHKEALAEIELEDKARIEAQRQALSDNKAETEATLNA